jgi:hypothetical protein
MALSSHYEMGRDLTLWEKHAGVGCPGELYSSWLVAGGWWLLMLMLMLMLMVKTL